MSLHPHLIAPVPEQTARVARAAFPKGHPYLTFRDALGTIFQDEDFRAFCPVRGHPGLPPWRLAVVTIMQLRENRADRQAAEAVRARIEWQYLRGLEWTDPGFDFSVLSAFRDRLLAGSAEALLLEKLLERCRALGLLTARGQQRTDAPHVLAAVRVLNRLELVAATLRAALNALATVAPAWLQAVSPLVWYERYSWRIEDSRLPQAQPAREASAHTVGEDGCLLLDALEAPDVPEGLRTFPSMAALRRTWQRHDERTTHAPASPGASPMDRIQFRASRDVPPAAEGIESPYDVEARYRHKRDTQWTGSMVHCSATCDPTAPHLLTHGHTTPATVQEAQCTEPSPPALIDKGLSPQEHLVEAAYISSALLVHSRDAQGITLRGPTRPSQGWQTQVAGADTLEQFAVAWEPQQVRCPQDHLSIAWWEPGGGQGSRPIIGEFDKRTCESCPVRTSCTRAKPRGRRLRLPPQEQDEALQAAQTWATSEAGQQL
jgi:transposase